MKKMVKSLAFAFSTVLVLGMAGCNPTVNVTEHVHTYSFKWSTDATHHWHAATCGDTDEVKDRAEHRWKDCKCEVCGADISNGTDGKTQGQTVKASWMATTGNLKIDGTEISKTSEIVVVPQGSHGIVEMTDDSAWSGYVTSSDKDIYKGVFLNNRKVKISPFVMSQYQVTRDLYKAVTGSDPSSASASGTQGENPVNYINWFDAIIFCNKLSTKVGLECVYSYTVEGKEETDPAKWISDIGEVPTSSSDTCYSTWKDGVKIDLTKNGYRLPTEAEWEYAARGGDTSAADWKYAFSGINVAGSNKVYDGSSYLESDTNLATVGWYSKNSSSSTNAVGQKKANRLGLYDMSGNVWEWCDDFYDSTATNNDSAYTKDGYVTDPAGATSGDNRCQRGGCWNYTANCCAVSYRSCSSPCSRNNTKGGVIYGLRLVRNAN